MRRGQLQACFLLLTVVLLGSSSAADSGRAAPTLEARAVAFAMARSDGPWRLRERGAHRFVGELTDIVRRATADRGWPDAELVLAKSWFESRWRPRVVGARGERGLVQLMPRWHRRYLQEGETTEDLLVPTVNIRVAVARLRDDYAACGGDPGRALRHYYDTTCREPRFIERIVLRWANEIRANTTDSEIAQREETEAGDDG